DRPGSPRQCPAMLPAAEHRQQHLFRLPPLEEDLFPREPRDPVTAFGEREVPSSVLPVPVRSEEHTSELQSRFDLVCRLLRDKKKWPTTEAQCLKEHPCSLAMYPSHCVAATR